MLLTSKRIAKSGASTRAEKKKEAKPRTVRGKRSAVADDDEKLKSGVVESSAQPSTSAGIPDSRKGKIDLKKSAGKELKELRSVTDEKTEEPKPNARKVRKQAGITAESEAEKNIKSPAQTSAGSVGSRNGKKNLKKKAGKESKELPSTKKVRKEETDEPKAEARKIGKQTDITAESEDQKNKRLTKGSEVRAASTGSKKFLGAHRNATISDRDGFDQVIYNANAEGFRSLAISFIIRREDSAQHLELLKRLEVRKWDDAIEKTGYDLKMIFVQGKYLYMNPGCPDVVKLAETRKDILDECILAESMGIKMYNFHPGSREECSVDEYIKTIADTIKYIIEKTSFIVLVIETMAGKDDTVGGKFEDIKAMIDLVKDQSRVGVSINTCHIFASGYDIRTEAAYSATMKTFDDVIGLKYLKAIHINDSKGVLGCKTDRLQYIGLGKIRMDGFRNFMNDPRLNGIPMVLQTTGFDHTPEILSLYELDEDCKAS